MKPYLGPLYLLLTMLVLQFLTSNGILPSQDQQLEMLLSWVASGGLFLIFAIAVAEHTVGVNAYFPGAVIILLAMSATAGDYLRTIQTFMAIVLGQLVGYIISYMVGRVGRFEASSTSTQSLTSWKMFGFFLAFAHPHSGAATSFAFGASGRNAWQSGYCVLLFTICWSIFWTVMSVFGLGTLFATVGFDLVVYIFIAAWLVLIFWTQSATRRY